MNFLEFLTERMNMSQRKALARKKSKSAKRNAGRMAMARKRTAKKREKVDTIPDQKNRAEKQAIMDLKKKMGARFNKGKTWDQASDATIAKFNRIKSGAKFKRKVRNKFKELRQDIVMSKGKLQDLKEPIINTLLQFGITTKEINSYKPLGTKKVNIIFKPGYDKTLITPEFLKQLEVNIKTLDIGIQLNSKASIINKDNYISLIFKV